MDAKLQEVLLDYGLEGYGLYWYCIELISSKVSKDNITFSLEHDARIIARNTGSTTQKVQEMMSRFVELGLFENSSGYITCFKLAKRLDQSMTSNPEMRQIIEEIKQNHDSVMTPSRKPMQDKIRSDQIKLDIDNHKPDKPAVFNFRKEFLSLGVDPEILKDWLLVRKRKNASNTKTAFTRIKNQIQLSGLTANEAVVMAAEKSWSGFEAEWVKGDAKLTSATDKYKGAI